MSSLLDPDGKGRMWPELAKRGKSAFAVLLSLAVLIGGGVFVVMKGQEAWLNFRTAEDYIGTGKEPVDITIPKGAVLADIADILKEYDVVRSAKAFEKVARENEDAKSIQAGRYRLKTQIPAQLALEMLLDPANQVRNQVQIIEGLRMSVQFEQLAKKTKLPAKDFTSLVSVKKPGWTTPKAKENLGLPKWAKGRPEGFFFPDTYQFDDDATAEQVLRGMVSQFKTVADDINFTGRAKDIGQSPYDALIVASIVQAEVSTNPEYGPKVARVLYNRLAKGQPLQLDTTVLYANNAAGKATTTDKQRASKSPYNTYTAKALPPGPINAPGKSALNAAVAPAKGKWLYFVTVDLDTGETLFANTWAEHEANVAKFQAWCQANTGRC